MTDTKKNIDPKNNKKKFNPKFPENTPKPKINIYWVYGIIALAFITWNILSIDKPLKEIYWGEFETDMLKTGAVEKIIVVNGKTAEIYINRDSLLDNKEKYKDASNVEINQFSGPGPQYSLPILDVKRFGEKMDAAQEGIPEKSKVPLIREDRTDVFGEVLGWLLPLVFLVVIWIFIMKRMSGGGGGGGQIFSIGKSKAKVFDKNAKIKVNFNDVAGLEEAKVEITEIVDFLKKPDKYTTLGGKIPKGALLVGPPGTGKTLLAKAVAGEAHVPFFSMSGSDFVEMFVGVGASRVRDLFKQAKEKSPCIIFIDEIDAIGRARGKNPNMGANDERENTLNQLLTEMDGFGDNSGVIILAATNRVDVLDKALLRAGRFDRQILVELPDITERKAIFKVHLKPLKKLSKEVEVDFLARQTPGFSGADIANVCNEAALIAARNNHTIVEKQDFLDAVDRIIGGLEKRNKVMTKEEKKTIAYHEAGHAASSWLLEHANPLVKVTIIPRGRALGAAWYLPEERQITTKEQMLDNICSTLAGRASEQINFGVISTGALNDLEKVTKQVYAIITYYGMSDKLFNVSYYDSTGQGEYSFQKPYSEETAVIIDKEVAKIIDEQYKRAVKILSDNKEKLEQLALILLEKEVIFATDLENIFGKRVWGSRNDMLEKEIEEDLALKESESSTAKKLNPAKETVDAPKDEIKEDNKEDNTEKEV